jgi:hypothetical protein
MKAILGEQMLSSAMTKVKENIVGEEVLSSVLPKFQELVSRVDRLCSFAHDFSIRQLNIDFKFMLRTMFFVFFRL